MNGFKGLLVERFIRPEFEVQFLEHYETTLKIDDKSGLAWEILYRVMDPSEVPFESMKPAEHGKFLVYNNIAVWRSLADIKKQLSQYMGPPEYYEYKPRRRFALDAAHVRLGSYPFNPEATCE